MRTSECWGQSFHSTTFSNVNTQYSAYVTSPSTPNESVYPYQRHEWHENKQHFSNNTFRNFPKKCKGRSYEVHLFSTNEKLLLWQKLEPYFLWKYKIHIKKLLVVGFEQGLAFYIVHRSLKVFVKYDLHNISVAVHYRSYSCIKWIK